MKRVAKTLLMTALSTTLATILPATAYNADAPYRAPTIINTQAAPITLRSFFADAEKKGSLQSPTFFSQALVPFLNEQYNAVGYADHLSRDGRHLSEFLQLAHEYQLSTEQTYTGLRLFKNKLLEATVIDDTVTMHVLEAFAYELERYFPLNPLNSIKQKTPAKMIENIMLTEFTSHLEKPATSTDQFFTSLSHTIAQSIQEETGLNEEKATRERLRALTLQAAQHLISHTLWYAQHAESVWPSFLKIAHTIGLLCSNRIITHLDDADDLYRSLVARFATFLDQTGHQLPIEWYENVESDLTNGLIPFLESPELDACITSKKEFLRQALMRGKTCAIAQQNHGLLLA